LVPQNGTILCCSQKADTSESREVYTPLRGTPPSCFSAFFCAARLREMTPKNPQQKIVYLPNDFSLNFYEGKD
jgi:hypothetical protein